MTVSRRTFLAGGTAAGALLVARGSVLAAPLGGSSSASAQTSRASRLFRGTRLAHADLHNHSLLSDGAGDPRAAFASMRSAGLDVAALTDHSTVAKALPELASELSCATPDGCSVTGIDEARWATTKQLADAANKDHAFSAIRGFEWSSPTLGHVNVWFSQDWTDPLSTAGTSAGEGLAQFLHQQVPGIGPALSGPLDQAVRQFPTNGVGMKLFYDWLDTSGRDAIAGFNHPGREPGRFGYFAYDARLRDRIVSLEVFNRGEDYLFEGVDEGFPSPLADCLNQGWRVGLAGVSDEHGTNWGYPDGKGRTGLWVRSLTRAGVREAMAARRFFSARYRGLRLDAAINGVQMGGTVPHRNGLLQVALDIDRGRQWWGRPMTVQLLQADSPLPRIVAQQQVRIPRPEQDVIRFRAKVDAADGRWLILRVTDPSQRADKRAPSAYAAAGSAVAYASPFWLDPDAKR